MSLSPQFLDELRARVSLAEVVGRRVRLIKRGREYIGLCPFHNEKTPSFSVVEDKGFYHCFGCGAHGDVVGFTMRTANLSFREAVEALANQAGLRIPDETPHERERAAEAASLHDVCEAACVFFERQLREPQGRAGLDYLRRRGLDIATIERFRLGWAPEERDALKRAFAGRFPPALLVTAGLLREAEGRESFDFFRGRVIFPIADRAGKVVAFGGRTLGDAQPKYLNSPDTPIFDKGRTLYALHLAKAAPRSEQAPILVEGYMDAIALDRAGFKGAVAPLGTALTETQLLELWKLGEQPIVCFDGDAAGQRAAGRALDRALPLLTPEHTLRFVFLPEKADPDSLIKDEGSAAFQRHLAAAMPVSEFLWRSATERREAEHFETPEKISRLEARLARKIGLVEDRGLQKRYRDFVADRIWDMRQRLRKRRDPRAPASEGFRFASPGEIWTGAEARKRTLEAILVAIAISHPDIVHHEVDALAMLEIADAELRELWQAALEAIMGGDDGDVRDRLAEKGFAEAIARRLGPRVFQGRSFLAAGAEKDWALLGLRAALAKYRLPGLEADKNAALERFEREPTEENWATVVLYREMIAQHLTESDHSEQYWEGDAGDAPTAAPSPPRA